MSSYPFVNLLGVKLTPLRMTELNEYVGEVIQASRKEVINCINIHKVNLACADQRVRTFLNDSAVVFADGAGVILGARILGYHVPERMQYGDWLWSLSEYCEKRGYSFFFLGCQPGIAEKAANVLRARFPGLRILGTEHGYFNRSPGHPENDAVIAKINAARPDVLIVGLGRPAQELWLLEHWKNLDAHVALTGGGAFDLISGNLRRGPDWLVHNGFEWLARLLIEPRRLWKRYLIGNPVFLFRVLLQKLGIRKYAIAGSLALWHEAPSPTAANGGDRARRL